MESTAKKLSNEAIYYKAPSKMGKGLTKGQPRARFKGNGKVRKNSISICGWIMPHGLLVQTRDTYAAAA